MTFDGSDAATELATQLAKRLAKEPDVLVAYLFGSAAHGRRGPLSDVDVGVLLAEGGDRARRHRELAAGLAEVAGSVDLVMLNDAPVAVGYRVLRNGKLLLNRDERTRVEHWARTVDRYLDMEPLRNALAIGVRHRIEEGRFGRS